MQVRFSNVAGMVRVAVLSVLREGGHLDASPASSVVELVGCGDPSGWRRLEAELPEGVAAVALLDDLRPHLVYRAMALGQGVACVSWEPERVGDVLVARAGGDLLLPCDVVHAAMAALPVPLTSSEIGVLPHLAAGLTAAQVAARTHFSERHVRRLRQSIASKSLGDDLSALWRDWGVASTTSD